MFRTTPVRDWMTSPVVSIAPDASASSAFDLMKSARIRHLPVVSGNYLVGIVSFGDLREASPSDATTLSIWEVNYLWEKLRVEQVMTTKVVTVTPETTVLDAVEVMLSHKFNSLPVVDANYHLVGMLTESNIFRMLLASATDKEPLAAKAPSIQ